MSSFLIADDSPAKRHFLQSLVKRSGIDAVILSAGTTEEAMALIDAHPDIAMAFVDYEIPTAMGPAVIAHMKARNPESRIALVTSADSAAYEREGRKAGAETFLCTSDAADIVEWRISDLLATWKENK